MSWRSCATGFLCCSVLVFGWNTRVAVASQKYPTKAISTAVPSPLTLKGNLSSASRGSFFTDMDMVNAQTGFVAGYWHNHFSIWKTTDGGLQWNRDSVPWIPKYIPNLGLSPPTVLFVSPSTGWVAWIVNSMNRNQLTVLHTTDGGRSWTRHLQKVFPVANYVQQISFWSAKDGWIRAFSGGVMNQGDTSVFHTTNAGQSWRLVSFTGGYIPNKQATPHALPEFDVPMPMVFTSPREGWVAVGNVVMTQTSQATLYRTTTEGKAWYPIHLPVPKPLQHGYATVGFQPVFSHYDGTVIFQYMGARNKIESYRTTNGGKTWTANTPLLFGKYQPVILYFLNPEIGWVVGSSGLMECTENGGQSWSDMRISGDLPGMLHNGYTIQKLDVVSPTVGWMMVEDENGMTSGVTTRILKTNDGGQTWQ